MSKPIPPFTEVQHFWKNEILKKGVSGTFTIDPTDNYKKYVFGSQGYLAGFLGRRQ